MMHAARQTGPAALTPLCWAAVSGNDTRIADAAIPFRHPRGVDLVRAVSLSVRADIRDVAPFAASVRFGGRPCLRPGAVPATFPIVWLAAPEIRAAFHGIVDADDTIIVHETQSFDYGSDLRVGAAYRLDAEWETAAPARHAVSCRVIDGDGHEVLRSRASFRAVDRDEVRAVLQAPSPPMTTTGIGTEVVGMRLIDQDRVDAYVAAARDDNPLHRPPTSHCVGRQAGAVIPGMLIFGLLEAAVADWNAEARIVRLSARFIAPLTAPETIAIRRRVVRSAAIDGGRETILRFHAGSAESPLACIADAVVRLATGPPGTASC